MEIGLKSVRLSGRKVLVTGASGFIGAHLSSRMMSEGAEVHGVSRYSRDEGDIIWHRADMADADSARAVIDRVRPDIIYHLASHVSGSRDLSIVQVCATANLMSAINVLTAATQVGCERLILTGSVEEPPSADSVATSPYSVAKGAATSYARMFHALYDTPVVMTRLAMVYGPAQYDLKKLVPYVTVSLLRNEAPALTSGRREVDWIYIDDVISGLMLTAVAPGVLGERVDFGSGKLVKVRDVALQLAREIGSQVQPQFGMAPERQLEQDFVADPAASYAKIAWRPTTALREGLQRTVEWYAARMHKGILELTAAATMFAQLHPVPL